MFGFSPAVGGSPGDCVPWQVWEGRGESLCWEPGTTVIPDPGKIRSASLLVVTVEWATWLRCASGKDFREIWGGMVLQLTLIRRRWVCVGQEALALAAFLAEHPGYLFLGGCTET